MGMTYAEATRAGPRGEKVLMLLVDPGSLLTWVPEGSLREIGVKPAGTRRFRPIEGRELVRKTGEAVLEVMGERATQLVVFGQPGDAEAMGVVSLEGLGFELDPSTRSLKKTDVFAAYGAA